MARGDEQRVWFPEMVDALRVRWHEGLAFDQLIALRDDLDSQLQELRSANGIHLPSIKCPDCGHRGKAAPPHVSVRAMILSLTRFDIAPAEQAYALEKSWSVYRREHGLDLYGKKSAAEANSCQHARARLVRS